MALLPVVGTVSYNGVVFPSALRAKCVVKPIYSRDGRSVKYRQYTVTVDAILSRMDFENGGASYAMPGNPGPGANGELDNIMEVVRQKLLDPGKELKFLNQGFGDDLTITATQDRDFGPKPEVLNWEPIGSNKACRVVWICVATITECANTTYSLFGDWSYEIAWSIGPNGLTTRTISGMAEAGVNRNGKQITATADSLREYFKFPVPEGFHRSSSFNLSPDKRQLNFSIVDSEIPSENAYPKDCVNISLRQRVSSASVMAAGAGVVNGSLWNVSFYGTIEVAPGSPKSAGWRAFAMILNQRLNTIKQESVAVTNGKDPARGVCQIVALDFEDDIFGREIGFSVGFKMVTSWESVIKATGIWSPIEGTSWPSWHKSLEHIQNNRGYAKMRHVAGDDVIINFCENALPNPVRADTSSRNPKPSYPLFQSECPPYESSWEEYDCRVKIDRRTNTTVHNYLGHSDSEKPVQPSGTSLGIPPSTASSKNSPKYDVQERSASEMTVTLYGRARRIGYQITAPVLESVNGKPAVCKRETIPSCRIEGYAGKCPIYVLEWMREYHVYSGGTGDVKVTGIPPQFTKTLAITDT